HADDAALEVGRGLDAGSREKGEADDVAERADGPDVAAGAIDPDHRREPYMHDVEPAGLQLGGAAAATVHVDDVDRKPLRRIEAGVAGHVPGQHGVHGVGNAGLESKRLSCHGVPSEEDEKQQAARLRPAMPAHAHRCVPRQLSSHLPVPATTQNSRNSRPKPAIRSSTPQRRSASQTIAWCAAITLTPNSRSSTSMASAVGQCGDGRKIESASGCSCMSLRPISMAAWRGMRPIWLKALPQPVAPNISQPKWAP